MKFNLNCNVLFTPSRIGHSYDMRFPLPCFFMSPYQCRSNNNNATYITHSPFGSIDLSLPSLPGYQDSSWMWYLSPILIPWPIVVPPKTTFLVCLWYCLVTQDSSLRLLLFLSYYQCLTILGFLSPSLPHSLHDVPYLYDYLRRIILVIW